jgi:hypothetical protein
LPDRAAHGQGQRIGVFVELGLGRELVGGELLRPVIGLLPQGQIRGGAVDLSFTLGDNFGTRPDLDALQFRIGHGFFGFGLAQLGDQFGIVDNQKGRTRRDVLATADRDLRQPAGDARGDVHPLLAAFSLHEQRFGARETPDRQTDKSTPVMTARGLRRTPRRGASVGGGAVECGWRCGGRRNFGHRFVAAMMGS